MNHPAETAPAGEYVWQSYWQDIQLIPPLTAEAVGMDYGWRMLTKDFAHSMDTSWNKATQLSNLVLEWELRCQQPETDADDVASIATLLQQYEKVYPDNATTWDSCRAKLADTLTEIGNTELAMQLLQNIQSNRILAEAVIRMDNTTKGRQAEYIYPTILNYMTDTTPERVPHLVQSFINVLIDNNPADPGIDAFEKLAPECIENYDPINSWAESQREELPTYDWDGAVRIIGDEHIWGTVPVHYRQHITKKTVDYQFALKAEVNTEIVQDICGWIDSYRAKFPDCYIWDITRLAFGTYLCELGWTGATLDVGRGIKLDTIKKEMVHRMQARGEDVASLELLNTIEDPRLAYMAVVREGKDPETRNSRIKDFIKLMEDDTYPLDWRIRLLRGGRYLLLHSEGPPQTIQGEDLLEIYTNLLNRLKLQKIRLRQKAPK